MTEHELEQRLRAWYRAEVESATAPSALQASVAAIPAQLPYRARFFQTRRRFVLLAATAMLAALLIGGAIAIGSGLLRLPWLPDDRNLAIGRPSGWVAYVVALTDWNTPDGPTYESPGSPTRIALVRDGESSPTYIGGIDPPEPGTPTDEWLSIRQQCPAFSPDGTRLAYFERRPDEGGDGPDFRGTIVIAGIDVQTLQTRDEIRIPDVDVVACPVVWSPDGQSVAFVNSDATGTSLITVAGLDGSQRELRNPAPALGIPSFAWSPSGSAIALIDVSYPDGSSAEGRLWLVPLDDGQPRLMYEGHAEVKGPPSWSADGTRIAIAAAAAPAPTPDANGVISNKDPMWTVLVVPVEDGQPVREIGRGVGPAWSPIGDRIAYLAGPPPGEELSLTGSIVVFDTSTGTEQVIPAAPIPPGTALSDYNMGGGSGFWQPHEPRWSPDGEALVFVGTDGIWGTAILLTAPATGEELPTAMSETWVTEWCCEIPPSWQVDAP